MAGSIYTFTGTTGNAVGSVQTSQGIVKLNQSGLFLPVEVQNAAADGIILKPGPAVSPSSQLTAPTVVAGASGLPNGVYRYAVTFVTAAGETLGLEVGPITLTSVQGSLSAIPVGSALSGVTARKIYRTSAGGSSGTEKLVATISDNSTTVFLDNIADGSLGANLPTSDSSSVLPGGGSIASQVSFAALGTDSTVGGPGGSPLNVAAVQAAAGGGGGGSSALTPTGVKSGAYTFVANDLVPVDLSGGNVPLALPAAPPDKTRVGFKIIAIGAGNSLTITRGGSDVFNKTGGSTVLTLSASFQGGVLQYASSTGIWYVTALETPTGVAGGAASLDSTTHVPIAQIPSSVATGSQRTASTTDPIVSTDHVIFYDATSAPFTATLPTAVGFAGVLLLEAITATTNLVTIATTSSQTIEGANTVTLGTPASGAVYTVVTLVSDGANWRIV